ncbi:uncharacterized protein [Ptychodera flava]|uniref:uncharacterized protein n=1 Tax=Ptychodera flava TaxID=63121 RepID=UPI00396A599E
MIRSLLKGKQISERHANKLHDPFEIFIYLEDNGHITSHNVELLKELLPVIGREELIMIVEEYEKTRTTTGEIPRGHYADTEREPHVDHDEDTTVVKIGSDDNHPSISQSDKAEATKTLIESKDIVKTKRGRVMIVGQYGVGKTSLKRSLFKEKFNENHDSTIGVELFQFSMDISTFFAGPDKSKGSRTQKEMRRRLADAFKKRLKKKSHSKPVPENSPEMQSRANRTSTTSENDEGTSLINGNESGPTNGGEELTDFIKQLQLEGEDEDKLITNLITTENQADIDSFIDFSLWGFAGQSEYYTTHQVIVFISNSLSVF